MISKKKHGCQQAEILPTVTLFRKIYLDSVIINKMWVVEFDL